MDTTDKANNEILTLLDDKLINVGSYCTFNRQYHKNKMIYGVGRLRLFNCQIVIVDFIQFYQTSYYPLWSMADIKLNKSNIQYVTLASLDEKNVYKIIKDG